MESANAMKTVLMAQYAMATRFEIVLHGANEVYLRSVRRRSFAKSCAWSSNSVSTVPTATSLRSTHLRPTNLCASNRAFLPSSKGRTALKATGGAFDITVAPLMRVWGFVGGEGKCRRGRNRESAGNRRNAARSSKRSRLYRALRPGRGSD